MRARQIGSRELSGSAVTYTLAERWASKGPSEGEWLAQRLACFNLARRDSHEGDGCGVVIKSNLLHASATETAMKITAARQGAHLVQIRANLFVLGER